MMETQTRSRQRTQRSSLTPDDLIVAAFVFSYSPFPLSDLELALVRSAALVGALSFLLLRGRVPWSPWIRFLGPWAGYGLVVGFAGIGYQLDIDTLSVARSVEYLLVLGVVLGYSPRGRKNALLNGSQIGLFGVLAYGLVGSLAIDGFEALWDSDGLPGLPGRLTMPAVGITPNGVGSVGLLLLLMALLSRRRSAFLVGIAAVLLSYYRTGLVLGAAAVASYSGVGAAIFAVAVAMILVVAAPTLVGEFLNRGDSWTRTLTLNGRTELWRIALQASRISPWFGLGFSKWSSVYSGLARSRGTWLPTYIHGSFAQVLVQNGIFGLLAYVGATVASAARLVRRTGRITLWVPFLVAMARCFVQNGMDVANLYMVPTLCLGITGWHQSQRLRVPAPADHVDPIRRPTSPETIAASGAKAA